MKKPYALILYLVLIAYFSLFFSQKIILATADLGRHITNGRVFFETGKIVSTNFYSYTEPQFPALNHHWLSGAVFYIVEKISGFTGLSIFYLIISGLTVFLFFKIAQQKSNFQTAFLVTVFLIPLIAFRKEIRPEGFSYLFLGLFYYLLFLFKENKLSFKKTLILILICQLLWVNLHIFFIFGLCIIFAFLFTEIINSKFDFKNKKVKKFAIILGAGILISIINPYGTKGFFEPFTILKEYGYMIIENQSIFFMQKRIPSFSYFHFEVSSFIFALIFLWMLFTKKLKKYLVQFLAVGAFMILAFRAIRGIPIFGLFFVPLLAEIFYKEYRDVSQKMPLYFVGFALVTLLPGHYFSVFQPGAGIGLIDNVNKSAEFFTEKHIKGPVFNNYDIGGYLIFNLYNREKVFVDNRPEAYSVPFFKTIYEPMQAKEEIWKEMNNKYNFNSIYFYRHDATPWAQPFLIQRLNDPEWAPVFVDNYVLILVKRNDTNKEITDKYTLPKSMFTVTK